MKSPWDTFIPSSSTHHSPVFAKACMIAQLYCSRSPWHWYPPGRLLPYDVVPSGEIQSCTWQSCSWKSLCIQPALFAGWVQYKWFLFIFLFKCMPGEDRFHQWTEVMISLEMPCWISAVLNCIYVFMIFFIFLRVQFLGVFQIYFKK